MFEGPGGSLYLRVHAISYRPALHEDDWVVTVLSRDGRREPSHKPRLGLTRHTFEALCREMVTLVDNKVTVLANSIVDNTLLHQALNDGDVHLPRWPRSATADSADGRRRQIEERREPLDPLIEELPPVHQHKRIYAALSDEPSGHDCLAKRRRRSEHPVVMSEHRFRGGQLLDAKVTSEYRLQSLSGVPFVANGDTDSQVGQRVLDFLETSARDADVVRVVFGTRDHARLVVGRQPHGLRLVELWILERRDTQQSIAKLRGQSFLGDIDLIAEHEVDRRGQFPGERRLAGATRRWRGPRLLVTVFLRRQPDAEDATTPFGDLHDAFGLHAVNPV